ncbi:hypothetical protein M885DRAFT_615338 [Pelagophyceae sp. CCMP2097]|nr:hypothetical protein M885DRAFT_615338 [Pelagophyceae sp. CCMP2097]
MPYAGSGDAAAAEGAARLEAWQREKQVRLEARKRRKAKETEVQKQDYNVKTRRQAVLEERREEKKEYVQYLREQLTKKGALPLERAAPVSAARAPPHEQRCTFGGRDAVATGWVSDYGAVATGARPGDDAGDDAVVQRRKDAAVSATREMRQEAEERRKAVAVAAKKKRDDAAATAQWQQARRQRADRRRWTTEPEASIGLRDTEAQASSSTTDESTNAHSRSFNASSRRDRAPAPRHAPPPVPARGAHDAPQASARGGARDETVDERVQRVWAAQPASGAARDVARDAYDGRDFYDGRVDEVIDEVIDDVTSPMTRSPASRASRRESWGEPAALHTERAAWVPHIPMHKVTGGAAFDGRRPAPMHDIRDAPRHAAAPQQQPPPTTTKAASERAWSEVADAAARALSERIARGRVALQDARRQIEAHAAVDDPDLLGASLAKAARDLDGGLRNLVGQRSAQDRGGDRVTVADSAWARTLAHAPGALFESLDLEMSLKQRESVAPRLPLFDGVDGGASPPRPQPLTARPAGPPPRDVVHARAVAENSYAQRAAAAAERARTAAQTTVATADKPVPKRRTRRPAAAAKPGDGAQWGIGARGARAAEQDVLRQRRAAYADEQRRKQQADRAAQGAPPSGVSTKTRALQVLKAQLEQQTALMPCERRGAASEASARRRPPDASRPPVDASRPPIDASRLPIDFSRPPVDFSRPHVEFSRLPVESRQPSRSMLRRPAMPPDVMASTASFDEHALMRSLQRLDRELLHKPAASAREPHVY